MMIRSVCRCIRAKPFVVPWTLRSLSSAVRQLPEDGKTLADFMPVGVPYSMVDLVKRCQVSFHSLGAESSFEGSLVCDRNLWMSNEHVGQ